MLRAVIYARCSTEEESQRDALKNQVFEAEECVRSNGWILVDKYVESKSGTTTKGRKEYHRLFQDLLEDKFDIIVIKSQDRLMRNTKDWYLFIDRLTTSRKKLYMYIDRKFYSTDDALITGIKAILAEDYSRELSKKINNAHKNRQKHGGKPILTSNVYGLKRTPEGTYEIEPEEAKAKIRMYELFAAGYGSYTISHILEKEGIVGRNGKPFHGSNITRMVKNPLNMGTVVMNKRHYDFDMKTQLSVPENEYYIYPDKVPAIVSKELWLSANEKIRERSEQRGKIKEPLNRKSAGKFPLSGKIVCGFCGKTYYRNSRKRYKDKAAIYEWKCSTYMEKGRNQGDLARPQIKKVQLKNGQGCDNVHLNEEKLLAFLADISEKYYQSSKERILDHAIQILTRALKEKDGHVEIQLELAQKEKYEDQLNVLLDKMLEGLITDEVYKKKQYAILEQIKVIDEKVSSFKAKISQENERQKRIKHICDALKEENLVAKASVEEMIDQIEKIVIYPERMEIHFSYDRMLGISMDILEKQSQQEILVADYGSYFNPRKQQKEDQQMVLELMEENPRITAREIAEKVGITTSGVYQRINKLRKEKKVRFVGKGGTGYWEVFSIVPETKTEQEAVKQKKKNLAVER